MSFNKRDMMNSYLFTLIFIGLFSYAYENYAMEQSLKPISSTIIKEISVPTTSQMIASHCSGRVIVMDEGFFNIINYREEEQKKESWTLGDLSGLSKKRLYTHPKSNTPIISFFDEINKCSKVVLCRPISSQPLGSIKDDNANILFSSTGSYFYTIKDKKIGVCNFSGNYMTSYDLTFDGNVIISEQISKVSCFLYANDTSLYKITFHNSFSDTEKLGDFFCPLNWDHWIYNPRFDLFCALTAEDQQLYIANIVNLEQKKVPLLNFKAAALLLHSNERILALISQSRDTICYFDSQKMQSLLVTQHAVLEDDLKDTFEGKIAACSPDGQDMMVLLSGKCLIINIPAWIQKIDIYEKYRLLRILAIIPEDMQRVIGKVLLGLYQSK